MQLHVHMRDDNVKENEAFRKSCDERILENLVFGKAASKQGFQMNEGKNSQFNDFSDLQHKMNNKIIEVNKMTD